MRIIALIFAIFIFGINAISIVSAEQITLEWDYPDGVEIDGFTIYSGPMGQFADGTWGPQYTDPPALDRIDPSFRKATITEPGWEGVRKKFCFTIDAFKGELRSEKAEFVCKVIDNSPPPVPVPQNVSGKWDQISETVTIFWSQDDLENVDHWKVFFKIDEESAEFAEIGTVDNDGNATMSLESPVTGVASGESKDVIFVVVAFYGDAYSRNSNEATVTIDRTVIQDLPDPTGLRFSAVIPVE